MGGVTRRASGRVLSLRIHWGAAALGVVAGLIGGIIISIPFAVFGLTDTATLRGQAVLILVGLAAQIGAGFIAGRLSSSRRPQTGGLAGLGLFAVVSTIAIAAGEEPGSFTVAFGAIVSFLMGTVGGVFAEAAAGPQPAESPETSN